MAILGLFIGGAVLGALASLVRDRRLAIGLLILLPITMLLAVHLHVVYVLNAPDLIDFYGYFYGPIWPSIGALAGYAIGLKSLALRRCDQRR